MLSLCSDIYLIISDYIHDKDKIAMSMVSREMNKLKYVFIYVDEISFEKIRCLLYFNNFIYVRLNKKYPPGQYNILPLNCKHIHVMYSDIDIPWFQTSNGKSVKIKHISFGDGFDGFNSNIEIKIHHICFASNARLTFGHQYNHSFSTILPPNITHLEFGFGFYRCINPLVLTNIKYLKFGTCFDQPINFSSLKHLTHLIFGLNFNQPIHGCLPISLLYLEFGMLFDQSIYESIPPSVRHLIFGHAFSYTIYRELPQTVTHLTLGKRYVWQMNCIPPTVTHLTINCQNYDHRLADIPSTVIHLTVNGKKFY
jgi:hypothetical protein